MIIYDFTTQYKIHYSLFNIIFNIKIRGFPSEYTTVLRNIFNNN